MRYGGHGDYRGGGHFSGRLTAPLVAAGALAKLILREKKIVAAAHIASVGDICDVRVDPVRPDMEALRACGEKEFPTLSDGAGAEMQRLILECRQDRDSIGGAIECVVTGLPMGLGAPDFDRNAETMFARQLFAIPAVKGLEFGSGFALAQDAGQSGQRPLAYGTGASCYRDQPQRWNSGRYYHGDACGVPGGGEAYPFHRTVQQTVDMRTGQAAAMEIAGRHDPCIVHRAVPVVEAAAALAAVELMKLG